MENQKFWAKEKKSSMYTCVNKSIRIHIRIQHISIRIRIQYISKIGVFVFVFVFRPMQSIRIRIQYNTMYSTPGLPFRVRLRACYKTLPKYHSTINIIV